MAISIKPLGNRVVIEPIEQDEVTASGIVLPDSAKEKPQRGIVVSVGNGKLLDSGARGALQVKPGDRVIFTSWAGEAFKVDGDELLLMKEDDILAVFEE